MAAKFHRLGDAKRKKHRTHKRGTHDGHCASDHSRWKQVDEQSHADGGGYCLGWLAAGEFFEIAKSTPDGKIKGR